jgi:hypothetical protein
LASGWISAAARENRHDVQRNTFSVLHHLHTPTCRTVLPHTSQLNGGQDWNNVDISLEVRIAAPLQVNREPGAL